ncbi:angiopoietin-related protein 3 [Ambystoma mexicanum]|uniref:angiopoietin-related protein 3 n=1 Tax=Ambystoma mexicanum TaxID=8296 RepID=UPI0037E95E02
MNAILILLCFAPAIIASVKIEKDEATFDAIPTEPRSRFAMLDDVRILANGLLQLGHGLKDFVQKTKVQINDIFQKLNIFDKSFFELAEQTNDIKEEEEELKKTTTKLQVNNEELKNMSRDMSNKIENLLQEKTQLQHKVGGLEKKFAQIVQGQPEMQEVSSLKNFVEQQDKNIKQLLNIVQEQHTQLNQQNNQIRDLEDKLSSSGFQESMKNSLTIRHPSHAATNPKNSTSETLKQNDTPSDCNDIYNEGERTSGIYTIKPNGSEEFAVYCEMAADGAWTVIQRRIDGALDFNQTWRTYVNGFGDLKGDFWLGLEKVHSISRQTEYTLHIEMEDWKNNQRHIEYTFTLGGKDMDYSILLSQTSGNIPSALTENRHVRFATPDHNSDAQGDQNCPEGYSGGWWYTVCGGTNLNGKYMKAKSKGRYERKRGVYWKPEKGRFYSLKSTKMMIQPTDLENFD